jgi:hypothetical protein
VAALTRFGHEPVHVGRSTNVGVTGLLGARPSSGIPASDPQGRHIRGRRHPGNQVVRVGQVNQVLSVLIAARPMEGPRPSFSRGGRKTQFLGHFGLRHRVGSSAQVSLGEADDCQGLIPRQCRILRLNFLCHLGYRLPVG